MTSNEVFLIFLCAPGPRAVVWRIFWRSREKPRCTAPYRVYRVSPYSTVHTAQYLDSLEMRVKPAIDSRATGQTCYEVQSEVESIATLTNSLLTLIEVGLDLDVVRLFSLSSSPHLSVTCKDSTMFRQIVNSAALHSAIHVLSNHQSWSCHELLCHTNHQSSELKAPSEHFALQVHTRGLEHVSRGPRMSALQVLPTMECQRDLLGVPHP